jgi:hypothetical protein
LEVKTRSTIRAKPGQHAILGMNADRRREVGGGRLRFDKLSAHRESLALD